MCAYRHTVIPVNTSICGKEQLESQDCIQSGFYECNRMPFGLTKAPAVFQIHMEHTLADLTNALVYLYDIIIHSRTLETHLEHLRPVFTSLREAGLKLKHYKVSLLPAASEVFRPYHSGSRDRSRSRLNRMCEVIAFTYTCI